MALDQHTHSDQANNQHTISSATSINDHREVAHNKTPIHQPLPPLNHFTPSHDYSRDEPVYVDCAIPLEEEQQQPLGKKVDCYINLPLIRSSLGLINLRSLKPVEVEAEAEAYPMVDVSGDRLEEATQLQYSDSFDDDEHNHDENGLAKKLFATPNNRGSAQAELMKSLNNIRLNMSHQHLIQGSRNIMGKVRGLSMADLNKQPTSSTDDRSSIGGSAAPAASGRKPHHYKTQFYALLISLALLFLYLIYQNLFS